MQNSFTRLLLFVGINVFAISGLAQRYELLKAEMASEHMKTPPVAGLMVVNNESVQFELSSANPGDNYAVQLPLIRTQTSRCDVVYTLAQKDLTKSEGHLYQIEVWYYLKSKFCASKESGTARVFYSTTFHSGTAEEKKVISRLFFRITDDNPDGDIADLVLSCTQQNFQADHNLTVTVWKDERSGQLILNEHFVLFGRSITVAYEVNHVPPDRSNNSTKFENPNVSLTVSPVVRGEPAARAIYQGTEPLPQIMWCQLGS